MEVKLTQKQKELVEKFGVFLERTGTAPAQARILALLMVCDKAELTFEEIHLTLKISKSAVSNAINSLMAMGRMDYYTKPGDRKRYFVNRIGHLEEDFQKNLNKLLVISTLLQEILDHRTKTSKKFNADLQQVIHFMEFLQKEMPDLYKKWRKHSR